MTVMPKDKNKDPESYLHRIRKEQLRIDELAEEEEEEIDFDKNVYDEDGFNNYD